MNLKEYYLTCLSEECDEVGQRISKALRFGLEEIQPDQPYNNAERILEELEDLICVYKILVEDGFLDDIVVTQKAINQKRAKIEKYMKISIEQGVLDIGE